MKLSRRDAAAMRLALECLRAYRGPRIALDSADEVLSYGPHLGEAHRIHAAMWGCPKSLDEPQPLRLLRARLALLLRATLRAAGELRFSRCVNVCEDGERWECESCGARFHHMKDDCGCDRGMEAPHFTKAMQPLWELAPKHSTREGAGRG